MIDQYLPVLIPESYTSSQKYITLKSESENFFSSLKNRQFVFKFEKQNISILDGNANCGHI